MTMEMWKTTKAEPGGVNMRYPFHLQCVGVSFGFGFISGSGFGGYYCCFPSLVGYATDGLYCYESGPMV